MTTLSEPMQKLLAAFRAWREAPQVPEVPKVHVDEIAAKIAKFYEKIRNVVDYQEEHLLRKRFIVRTLKRRLLVTPGGEIAEALIKEIIRSGHLPNDTIPQEKISEVQRIIDGMRLLTQHAWSLKLPKPGELETWLLHIAANAIEERLVPPTRDLMLFDLAFQTMKHNLAVAGATLPDADVTLQLFIALQRSLFRVDDDQLSYRMLQFVYPNWSALEDDDSLRIAPELPLMKINIERAMQSPALPAFEKLCNRYNTAFFLIGDIIDEYKTVDALTGILQDEAALKTAVQKAYERRFARERGRLRRLAFFSVLSFLISKIAVALAIEIPIETYITHSFSLVNTTLNILFPPFLMLMIVAGIRMPGSDNLALATAAVSEVIDGGKTKRYAVAVQKKRSVVSSGIIYGVYLALFVVSFFVLYRALTLMRFNIANVIVFALFISLVLAAGVKIKNRARELSLAAERPTVSAFILDLFIFPFITVGQWIIAGLSKFNVLVLAMSLTIELPFQFLVEFLENFRGFIESKKDELR